MSSPLEKKEDTGKILFRAALFEGTVLLFAILGFLYFDNIWFLVAGVVLGALIMIPNVLEIIKLQKRDENASG